MRSIRILFLHKVTHCKVHFLATHLMSKTRFFSRVRYVNLDEKQSFTVVDRVMVAGIVQSRQHPHLQ